MTPDQTIGPSPKTAISSVAGATNAHPARCSDPSARLVQLTPLARHREDAVHLLGGLAERRGWLGLPQEHALHRLADHARDLRVDGGDRPHLRGVRKVLDPDADAGIRVDVLLV